MGYLMSRYDDVRLDGAEWSIEKRSESVVFLLPDNSDFDHIARSTRFEVTYEELDSLKLCFEVLQDQINGQSCTPSEEKVAQWRQEEKDAKIMEKFADLDVEELKRYLELKRGQDT